MNRKEKKKEKKEIARRKKDAAILAQRMQILKVIFPAVVSASVVIQPRRYRAHFFLNRFLVASP